MNRIRLLKRVGLLIVGQVLLFSPLALHAQGDTVDNTTAVDTVLAMVELEVDSTALEELVDSMDIDPTMVLVGDIDRGMAYFQGGAAFDKGGPSCIACHNVNHEDVYPGGLFAKDLTDVYSRLGDGLISWLGAPPFPAMAATYNNNPLTEQERVDLTAFLKYTDEVKDNQIEKSGAVYFVFGGGLGLLILLILVQLLWSNRKRKMVKADIFARQNKAWDAKF